MPVENIPFSVPRRGGNGKGFHEGGERLKSPEEGRSDALYKTILSLRDLDECRRFFDDLCTPTELRSLEQRFDVAVYLQRNLVYSDILRRTGASSATVSRVRRSMLEGGAGGVMRQVILREGLANPEEAPD